MSELEDKYEELFKDSPFIVNNIMHVNQKPHPYTIGAKHIVWASDHWGGMLGKEAILDGEKHGVHCAHPRCNVPYDEHTEGDHILFLSLKDHVSHEKASTFLKSVSDELQKDKIDGIALVETKEKYRISK